MLGYIYHLLVERNALKAQLRGEAEYNNNLDQQLAEFKDDMQELKILLNME